jgi:hypothetical protein
MNKPSQVEVIIIGRPKPLRFVAKRPIAIRLTEVATVASTLAELVTLEELNGIRLLCKAFEIEVTK